MGVTGELEGPPAITGNLSMEQKQELVARCGASPGDVILFAAGLPRAVNRTLDAMRTYLAENLGFIDKVRKFYHHVFLTDYLSCLLTPSSLLLDKASIDASIAAVCKSIHSSYVFVHEAVEYGILMDEGDCLLFKQYHGSYSPPFVTTPLVTVSVLVWQELSVIMEAFSAIS